MLHVLYLAHMGQERRRVPLRCFRLTARGRIILASAALLTGVIWCARWPTRGARKVYEQCPCAACPHGARVTRATAAFAGPARNIPLVVHQTAPTFDLPAGMRTATETWIASGFEHRLYDDAAVAAYVGSRGDAATRAAFAGAATGAARADLWRVLVLYCDGGVYADVDTLLVDAPRLVALVAGGAGDAVAGCWEQGEAYGAYQRCVLDQSLMAYRAGHPILRAYLDAAPRAALDAAGSRLAADAWRLTGPGALSRAAVDAGFRPRCDGSLSASLGSTLRSLDTWMLGGAARPKYRGYAKDLARAGATAWDFDDGDDDDVAARPYWATRENVAAATFWPKANATCLWRAVAPDFLRAPL